MSIPERVKIVFGATDMSNDFFSLSGSLYQDTTLVEFSFCDYLKLRGLEMNLSVPAEQKKAIQFNLMTEIV